MNLIKTNETVNRKFVDGEATEEVVSIAYHITESGNVIGSASVANGHFIVNAQIPGTMEEIKEKIERMFE